MPLSLNLDWKAVVVQIVSAFQAIQEEALQRKDNRITMVQ